MIKTYATHFCGIGGACWGIEQAGLACVHAIDIKQDQVDFRAKNLGHQAVCDDITLYEFKDADAADLLWTSPPCQTFSTAAREQAIKTKEDARDNLFLHSIRYVEKFKPRFVVLENVTGLLTHAKGETLNAMRDHFKRLGYHVEYNVLNAVHWLPQERERIFMVASRDGEKGLIPSEDGLRSRPFGSIMEHGQVQYGFGPGTYKTIISKVGRVSASTGSPFDFRLVGPEDVLPTITCGWGGGATRKKVGILDEVAGVTFLRHPTPREGARAQGLPDSWQLPGDTLAWEMIGNAVPSEVARAIVWHIKQILSGSRPPFKKRLSAKMVPSYSAATQEDSPPMLPTEARG